MRLTRGGAILGKFVQAVLILTAIAAAPPVAAQVAPLSSAGTPGAEPMMPVAPPPDCSGYSTPRVFLEVQAWWEGANTPDGMAHLHAGTCFPLGQRIHGRVHFDVRVIMHNNPGHLFSLSAGVFGGQDNYLNVDKRCSGTCTWWFHTWVNTKSTLDGWHEFRFKPRVRFDNGKRMLTSTGWPAYIDNGARVGDENRRSIGALVGRGWYEGHGYQNPQFENARAALRGAQSGVWRPAVRLDRGAQGFTPTRVGAYVDPDFHTGDPGMVVLVRRQAYRGDLAIDTTQLMNGWHKLVLKVTANHNGKKNTGVEAIYFRVQN